MATNKWLLFQYPSFRARSSASVCFLSCSASHVPSSWPSPPPPRGWSSSLLSAPPPSSRSMSASASGSSSAGLRTAPGGGRRISRPPARARRAAVGSRKPSLSACAGVGALAAGAGLSANAGGREGPFALATAAALAKHTGRELLVVWIPDPHTDCLFSQLFETTGMYVSSTDVKPIFSRGFRV